MYPQRVKTVDEEYVQKEEWKCSKHPAGEGGHYYILGATGDGECKYCGVEHTHDIEISRQYCNRFTQFKKE